MKTPKSRKSPGALTVFLLAVAVLAPEFSRAAFEIPELSIKENGVSKKLELRELSIDVRLEGILVETILELEFFNHTTRRQEGEFSLQLPEGATVSTYALDINGKMRPGVSVEKERARHAYETIKRKMIDPGLVEREAGNIYRTRIFPIDPQKPKRVRIGYIRNLAATLEEPLAADARTIPFEFKLNQKEELKLFRCRVTGAAAQPLVNAPNVPGARGDQKDGWSWEAKNIVLAGSLRAKSEIPSVGDPLVRNEGTKRGSGHFVVQGRLPDLKKPGAVFKPKKIRLIWDASLSGRNRDHEKEIAAVVRYLKWAGDVTVSLEILRDRMESKATFSIRGGKADELVERLGEITYDGAANFSQIVEGSLSTLLVTDGEKTSPIWALNPNFKTHHLTLVTSTSRAVDPGLLQAAAAHADLLRDDWWEVLTGTIPTLIVEGLPKSEWNTSLTGGFYVITGQQLRWSQNLAAHRNGRLVADIPQATRLEEADPWTFTRRIWADQQLRALEKAGDPVKITEFAKAERLVSDYTSLIVLERFQDHLTYRIPPPEPDLLAEYEEAIEKQYDSARQIAIRAWKKKLMWHQTDFPWMDSQLHDEAAAVSIWVKASRSVFAEEELNKVLIEALESWLPKARTTIGEKNTLANRKDFVTWKSDVGRRIEELKRIREKRTPPERDQEIHVSIRGFVKSRGVISHGAPLSLKEAIELSGGPFMVPLSRVYLYRDALRTGYNLESSQFTGVPLFDGDMVVIEADYEERAGRASGGGAGFAGDPFSSAPAPDPFAAPAASGNPAKVESPVFEETGTVRDSNLPIPTPNPADFAPDSAVERKLKIDLVASEPKPMATEIDEAVLETLQKHADPFVCYQDFTGKRFLESAPSAATLIEIARYFFVEKKDADLGTRILSNLVEIQANKFEATRAMAYWMVEFDSIDRGIEILKKLAVVAPDDASRAIASYDLAQVLDQKGEKAATDWFATAVADELKIDRPGALSTIALTDHFRRNGQPAGTLGRGNLKGFLADPMDSDVRIVVTSSGDQVDLFVTEPESETATGPIGTSNHGGRVDQSQRVQEYQVRFGMPGAYQLKCRRTGFRLPPKQNDPFFDRWKKELLDADLQPITIQVSYYTRWGTDKEERRVRTYLMENLELELDGLEFGWAE